MELHQEIENIEDFALMVVDQADDNVVLPIELTNTTGICLQQLNTDCLMEIFSNNSLTLTDLCSIAETCTRFKEITEQIFPKDLSVSSHCYTDNECDIESKKYGKYRCPIQLVERILKNFGPYISAVSMSWHDKLPKLVAKYCDTAIFQSLYISGFEGGQGKELSMKIKSIFQRTLALSFKDCDLRTLVTDPYIIDSLIELKITSSSRCIAILINTFPKLERFTFYKNTIFSEYNFDSEILPNFLRRHKRLRTLHLGSESVCCSSRLMKTIAKHCTKLTDLTLERWKSPRTSYDFSNIKNLRKLSMLAVDLKKIDHRQLVALLEVLQSLTTLKLVNLNDVSTQTFCVLSQLPNLRELHLEYGHFDQIPWSRLTQLKALHLRRSLRGFSASHLLHIIRELTNLEELSFYRAYAFVGLELSSEDFSEIVKIVKRRPNKLTLRLSSLANNYVRNENVDLIECTDFE